MDSKMSGSSGSKDIFVDQWLRLRTSKQEMETDLIIQAIKNSAEVAANLKGKPLIKEENKYNPNCKALKQITSK